MYNRCSPGILIQLILKISSKRMVSAAASHLVKDSVKKKALTPDNLNPHVIELKFTVEGPVAQRASIIENELKTGHAKPYKEVLMATIGDCQAMGQIPITFIRQVLASCLYPELLKSSQIPEDVKERAKIILSGCRGGSLGTYSPSTGIELVRKQVAKYIEQRDGLPCNWQHVFLSTGSTYGIRNVFKLFCKTIDGKLPGVMLPIPQHPLYSASTVELNMKIIDYYLDESNNWAINVNELERAVREGKKNSHPRILSIINPGNPTGGVLSKAVMEEVIRFAHKENLFIFADEVYQNAIHDESVKFYSFKKVMMEMGEPYSGMEMISFMSLSKGYSGEAGFRGGCHEIINMDPQVLLMYNKEISVIICPSTVGQAGLFTLVFPPVKGEPSYEKFVEEKEKILNSYKLRAKMATEKFNAIPGYTCNTVQGSIYAFPQIKLPPKAIEAATKLNQPPDEFYALQLLEEEGICVLPGSAFGQKPGTHHFRITILPEVEKYKIILDKIEKFHGRFMQKYN